MHTLQSLPIEIIASILPFLPTPATLRLRRCSKTLASKISINQTFWRNQLLFGDLIDYLWDLDPQMCHKKDKQGSWDWKTLAQILLQPKILQSALALSLHETENDEITTIFEKMSLEETEFKDAPIGLQNRCRIVRIVKDIEKMDKIEAEELVLDGEKQRHLGLLYS